ncbi:MAG: hypothetical protein JW807_17700 [Spirochaetes bacterium]|nr:hypothetical protein [Spirochaetota bacterium]
MKLITRVLLLTTVLTGLWCAQNPYAEQGIMTAVGAHCSIYDATHNDGNRHFYFRAPIVPDAETSGTFDPTLKPMVEICIWNGSSCGPSLAMFNEFTGEGSEAIRVDEAAEHYIVNWHTDNILNRFTLNAGETYRIRILAGSQLLGYADLAVVNSGKDLKNVDTNEYVPLLDGRTLPIKFRIEEGALLTARQNMTSGFLHSCMLDDSGRAWCWGYNNAGQLGNGNYAIQYSPALVSGGHTFKAITTGYYHTCAITTDGDAYCWGHNNYGQVGNSTISASEPVPVLVSGNHKFKSLDADYYTTCGLTEADELYCWGNNSLGQFGIGAVTYTESTPVPAAYGINVTSFGVGAYNICVLDENQSAYCSGYGFYGANGNGSSAHMANMAPVSGGHIFRSISVNYFEGCGIDLDNKAWCWGQNAYGQLGNGTINEISPYSVYTPVPVAGGISFQSITIGVITACGISTSGEAYCWGLNNYGQAGTGTNNPDRYASPQPVIGTYNWLEIHSGFYHTCGITDTGDAYCWGFNGTGMLGNGTGVTSYQPVAVAFP